MMKSIAIMQPYAFPYIGYFQLIAAVDEFIFLDDVTFIKQGFINRNKIYGAQGEQRFTLPVNNISSNKKINDHYYKGCWSKFYSSLDCSYARSPFYANVIELIKKTESCSTTKVSEINANFIVDICRYIGLTTQFETSSKLLQTHGSLSKGAQRLAEICNNRNASVYINSPGGKDLYDQSFFRSHDIRLSFLEVAIHKYKQGTRSFIPGLSIIDVLMWNPPHLVLSWAYNCTCSLLDD